MEEQEIKDSVEQEDKQNTLDAVSTDDDKPTQSTGSIDPPQLESSQLSAQIQYWMNRALHFFSHASNETLGACFVGLGASTYLVLGRVGLVLIGVVGGIALHATWDGSSDGAGDGSGTEQEARKRREMGLEVVHRVWRWRDRSERGGDDTLLQSDEDLEVKILQGKTLDFTSFDPETAKALDVFTTAVIRDYVKWWYSPVLPGEESFPDACRQTLTAFLLSLSGHISRKRPTEMFLTFIINSSSIIIALLAELSAALNASPNTDAATAIDTYITMKPESSLAQMLDQVAQQRKLDLVAEDILQNFLDPKAYNFPPVHGFLRQILSKLVLGMTLETCSKDDWINGWILYLLEDGEPELLQVIDDSIEQSADGKAKDTFAISDVTGEAAPLDHRRQKSRAEEAMEEALDEARRLTQLIQEDELRRVQAQADMSASSEDVSIASADTGRGIHTPTSSQSESDKVHPGSLSATSASHASPERPGVRATDFAPVQQFTSFDQLPAATPPAITDEAKPVLTLHMAKISIFDDSVPGEKTRMKAKPTGDYLIQIEPLDSRFSGWMIARKYIDFEMLHEVLRRISVITGVPFTTTHTELPNWKQLDKPAFRLAIEQYLTDAVKYQPLAESEGMKRFLEKDQGLLKSPAASKGLGWPDPLQMGKGMFDVLAKAPKEVAGGVAGGGKAFIGGVTTVFGGAKKPPPTAARTTSSNSIGLANGSPRVERSSTDLLRRNIGGTPRASQDSMERPTGSKAVVADRGYVGTMPTRTSTTSPPGLEERSTSMASLPAKEEQPLTEPLNLPPPPSAIDEYESPGGISPMTKKQTKTIIEPSIGEVIDVPRTPTPPVESTKPPRTSNPQQAPMSEQEVTVTVDLLFAVISELYTLSSAWSFRRTLLQAARTFLLRPGNPQLEAIRVMIQESVIDANSSDDGIAKMIYKTRENSLPTEEELKKWPPPLEEKEKDELRIKARKLLVERGMPQALTSVMGAAASGEALGKVFDCLQIQRVAKSVMFGLMLQALRAAVQ